MQNSEICDPIQSGARKGSSGSLVSDLVELIGHIQAATEILELAISEAARSDDQEPADNVFVLDDVTPRFTRMRAGLDTCKATLSTVMHLMLEQKAAELVVAKPAGFDGRPMQPGDRPQGMPRH